MEPNTLSRRYELPTCLLEISTERSPLSDWQSQTVAQNLQFRLQLTNTKKVIRGNQQQITNLIEVVTAYCDRWLAQDDFETLNHAIAVPKLTKLKLSTLQLFDLYESLELCASEFVILPNLVLEVRRLNPNWLKVIAGAIAIVGVGIGVIRSVSAPFGEQPSYQIASTPALSDSEKTVKSSNQVDIPNLSSPAAKPNTAIAPNPAIPSPVQKDINRDFANTERTDKVAIAPDVSIPKSVNRQRGINNAPAMSSDSKVTSQPRRLESANTDALSKPTTVTAESSKPTLPALKSPITPPDLGAPNDNIRATTNIGNIKVLQIQSELPSDITAALVGYIQAQPITAATGTIAFDLEVSGDRIINISVDRQDSTLKDNNAIAKLQEIISNWRSPIPVTGKIRLLLQQ